MYKKILFCTDLYPASDYTFASALDLAEQSNAELIVLHVLESRHRYSGQLITDDGEVWGSSEVFNKLKPLRQRHFLIHITGTLYEAGNEYYHVPIKKGDMPLAPVIEIILDNNYNVTFISESPLLEHDAVYIRLQVEKAIMKRTGKEEADYRDLSEIT